MLVLSLFILTVGIIEIYGMWKKKQKKEIVIFVSLAIMTLALGFFYILNPYRESLAQVIINLIGYGD